MGVKVRVACEPTGLLTKEVEGETVFAGFEFADGQILESDLVVYGIGIAPRDELASQAGIDVSPKGGIVGEQFFSFLLPHAFSLFPRRFADKSLTPFIVGDDLMTSAQDVYAIGECASWRSNVSLPLTFSDRLPLALPVSLTLRLRSLRLSV